jgi:SPP1 family predicted phage head-tail adaptor
MKIGAMRYKVQIQSATRAADSGGGAALTWTKVADVYADIQPQNSKESVFGTENQIREVTQSKIYIRYRKDVSFKNRIVQTYSQNGVSAIRTFNINGVVNVGNRFRFLELTCEEGVPT